jgi:Trypsin-co-occurring domain 2
VPAKTLQSREAEVPDEDDQLSIKTLIRAVTDELLASRKERLEAGDPAIFEVEDLTLEISFVAARSKEAEGGFKFWVVKAGGNVKYDDQSVQKIVLKLKATELTENEPFGLKGKFRPRRIK